MILLADGNRLLAIRFAFFDIGATPPRGFARAPAPAPPPRPLFHTALCFQWYQNGARRDPVVSWSSPLFMVFGLSAPINESRRADSNRLPLLITSEPSPTPNPQEMAVWQSLLTLFCPPSIRKCTRRQLRRCWGTRTSG